MDEWELRMLRRIHERLSIAGCEESLRVMAGMSERELLIMAEQECPSSTGFPSGDPQAVAETVAA